MNRKDVAFLQEISRHGFPHDAKADETDMILVHELPPG
jgi:hypothetical protein